MSSLHIRKASSLDAAGIVKVLEAVASERIHSAIDKVRSVEQEADYLNSLSNREAFYVAVEEVEGIVGFQSLDLWSSQLSSMSHVGQVGTFLLPEWRGHGIGRQLWNSTRSFAHQNSYRKFAIQVRATNTVAQSFYGGLGFKECGRLTRQVIVDGIEDDEVLMEYFF